MNRIDIEKIDRIARTICYAACTEKYFSCSICDPNGLGLGKDACIMVEQFRYEAIEVLKELMRNEC